MSEDQKSQEEETEATSDETPKKDPVRRLTQIVLVLCLMVFVWYLAADRYTPFTSQARVRSLVVPIVPRVSGHITEVEVGLHSFVAKDDVLFQLDRRLFQLAVNTAEAARNASALSWVRYEGGMTSFLEFLTLQRSLFSSQLLASEAQRLRITSVIQLYQALGGGWTAAQDSVFTETIDGEQEGEGE